MLKEKEMRLLGRGLLLAGSPGSPGSQTGDTGLTATQEPRGPRGGGGRTLAQPTRGPERDHARCLPSQLHHNCSVCVQLKGMLGLFYTHSWIIYRNTRDPGTKQEHPERGKERQRETQRETERETHTQRERETERERERERERDKHRGRGGVGGYGTKVKGEAWGAGGGSEYTGEQIGRAHV